MRIGDIDPDLSFQLKVAAAFYGISPSECNRIALRTWLDGVADSSPFLAEVMALQR